MVLLLVAVACALPGCVVFAVMMLRMRAETREQQGRMAAWLKWEEQTQAMWRQRQDRAIAEMLREDAT